VATLERVNRPLRVALLALGAAAFALAVHVDLPLCPLAGSFGVPCPGCGLTRATLALLHGDVVAALRLHPLVLLLSPLAIGLSAALGLELLRNDADSERSTLLFSNTRRTSVLASYLLVLTLGVWLLRFAGYLGGPVPVTSMRDWLAERAVR
jgi:Protein of unknown function (DUF2752)